MPWQAPGASITAGITAGTLPGASGSTAAHAAPISSPATPHIRCHTARQHYRSCTNPPSTHTHTHYRYMPATALLTRTCTHRLLAKPPDEAWLAWLTPLQIGTATSPQPPTPTQPLLLHQATAAAAQHVDTALPGQPRLGIRCLLPAGSQRGGEPGAWRACMPGCITHDALPACVAACAARAAAAAPPCLHAPPSCTGGWTGWSRREAGSRPAAGSPCAGALLKPARTPRGAAPPAAPVVAGRLLGQ